MFDYLVASVGPGYTLIYFRRTVRKSDLGITFGIVKRLTAIAFIFLLAAQCIFKLTIITYFEANRDYIAEVLCVNREKPMTMCNGQCFLDRNLSLADDDTEKTGATIKLSLETSPFVPADFQVQLEIDSRKVEKSPVPDPLYDSNSQRKLFHPPC